ncbi:MAG: hypothetical protein ACI9G1_000385, partial [Pirellulaceae bacterium]
HLSSDLCPRCLGLGLHHPMRFLGLHNRFQRLLPNSETELIRWEEHFPVLGSTDQCATVIGQWFEVPVRNGLLPLWIPLPVPSKSERQCIEIRESNAAVSMQQSESIRHRIRKELCGRSTFLSSRSPLPTQSWCKDVSVFRSLFSEACSPKPVLRSLFSEACSPTTVFRRTKHEPFNDFSRSNSSKPTAIGKL